MTEANDVIAQVVQGMVRLVNLGTEPQGAKRVFLCQANQWHSQPGVLAEHDLRSLPKFRHLVRHQVLAPRPTTLPAQLIHIPHAPSLCSGSVFTLTRDLLAC